MNKSFLLKADPNELKVKDLRQGITELGGKMPQGNLKANLIEAFIQTRQQYLQTLSANTATFVSQSSLSLPDVKTDAPQPKQSSQLPINAFAAAPQAVSPIKQSQDLTLGAFQITGANLQDAAIKQQLEEQKSTFVETKEAPIKQLKPPKGIERTPNFDDLESFIRPKSQVQRVDLNQQISAVKQQYQASAQSVQHQRVEQSVYNACASQSDALNITTAFPDAAQQSGGAGRSQLDKLLYSNNTAAGPQSPPADSTIQIQVKAQEFQQISPQAELQRTQNQIDFLHQQMRSVLQNTTSPLRSNAELSVKLLPAGQPIAESEGEAVKKPARNPKPVVRQEVSAREISRAKSERPRVGRKRDELSAKQLKIDNEQTESNLREEDLRVSTAGPGAAPGGSGGRKNERDGASGAKNQSILLQSTVVQRGAQFAYKWQVLATALAAALLTAVLFNAYKGKTVLPLPGVQNVIKYAIYIVLPKKYVQLSQSLFLSDGYINGQCPEGQIQLVVRDKTQIADFKFKLVNSLVNFNKWLHYDKTMVFNQNFACVSNETDDIIEFEQDQQIINLIRQNLVQYYVRNAQLYRHELDCYTHSKCTFKQKRETRTVKYEDVNISINQLRFNPSIAQQTYFNLQMVNDSIVASANLNELQPRFSSYQVFRINFSLHPLLSVCKVLVYLLVLVLGLFSVFKIMIYISIQSNYKQSIVMLKELKKKNANGSLKSSQLMAQMLDSPLPEIIKEEILQKVEKLLQNNDKVDIQYKRNVFGEVEMEFCYVGSEGIKGLSCIDDEESTHSLEY